MFMAQTVYNIPVRRNSHGRIYTAHRAKPRHMSLHERLKKARIMAKYPSSAEAARAFGWNLNTYRSNENGSMPFGRTKAIRYATAFRVRLDWLLDGKGPMRSARTLVKVVGKVGAGAAVYPIDDGGIEPVEPPFEVADDAVAFIVDGDSMYPAYRPGVHLIAKHIPLSEVINTRSVVTLEDGRRMVKDVVAGSKRGFFTLHSINGLPMVDVRIIEAAKVIGTVEP